jgi:hypothetical protein
VLTVRRALILICGVVPLAAGIVLIASNDAHGVAIVLGAVFGVIFCLVDRRLQPVSAAAA